MLHTGRVGEGGPPAARGAPPAFVGQVTIGSSSLNSGRYPVSVLEKVLRKSGCVNDRTVLEVGVLHTGRVGGRGPPAARGAPPVCFGQGVDDRAHNLRVGTH